VKRFKSPKRSLGDLEAESAATLVTAASDLSLVVDARGVIRDMAVGSDELSQALERAGEWTGRPWVDTVTPDTRAKVESLLGEASASVIPRWRQVNHPTPGGPDIPVLYSAVQIARGRTVAVGRDLRPMAALQQRLMEAQQSIERDYWRMHHAETRYRLLFQMASEAILIVDAATEKVVEANPAADVLLGDLARRLMGRTFPEIFDAKSTHAVQALLAGVRATGRADEVRARLHDGKREFVVSASLFRQESSSLYLVRLTPRDAEDAVADARSKAQEQMVRVLESAPDAFVVTAADGRILTANRAFLDLAQLATEEQARNESLERWLGRPGVDLSVLVANLKQHGAVRLFATTLRGEYGTSTEVEISAVAVSGDQPCYGFAIRNVGRRLASDAASRRELPRSVEQLTELVGRVSLKDLVREATDVIERLCIEAALELTGDNRASAAEMLGLSRQSLYVKLRRYGLGDLATEQEP
jgi:transcriptional regulator PpsR